MNKIFENKRKLRFINRGIYFLKSGEYKGSFVVNITEFDTPVTKAVLLFPDLISFSLTKDGSKRMFEAGELEYVKTLPKNVYAVCVEQFKGIKEGKSISCLTK